MKQGMAQNEPAQPIYEGLTRNAAIILMFVAFMLTSAVGHAQNTTSTILGVVAGFNTGTVFGELTIMLSIQQQGSHTPLRQTTWVCIGSPNFPLAVI